MKRIVWLITFLLVFPIVADATECTGNDRERLQKLANNITIAVEEVTDENGNITFAATFAGLSDELIIRSSELNFNSFNVEDYPIGYAKAHGLKQNKVYQYSVEGFDKCYRTIFRNITINTPKYNPYYSEIICENNREFYMCQKWGNFDKTYEEFEKEITEHINSNKNVIVNDDTNQDDTFYLLYKKYYWPCLITLIAFLGLLIFLWVRENEKNKL